MRGLEKCVFWRFWSPRERCRSSTRRGPGLRKAERTMTRRLLLAACVAIVPVAVIICGQTANSQPQAPNVASASDERALLNQYCVVCHNQKAKTGGMEAARKLTLDTLDVAHVEHDAETWEKVVRDIRSEEHTSELQSHLNLVCRLLLEKKKNTTPQTRRSTSRR